MPRRTVRRAHVVELVTGLVFLAGAGGVGIWFVHRPTPNRFDANGFSLLGAAPNDRTDHLIADAGSLKVLLIGVGVLSLAVLVRDRARALACLIGPVVAVVVTERVGKPLVSRHLFAFGASSYPSGTVTAVGALAAALALVAPRPFRPIAAILGAVAVCAVGGAVVAMRWHFPTDAAGGALVGVGAVVSLDGLFHLMSSDRSSRRQRGEFGSVERESPVKHRVTSEASRSGQAIR